MTISNTEFIQILEKHKAIIYKITRSYSYEVDERKDLEQEIIIQIWRSLRNYKSDSKLSTWIYRVALNVAISHLRKDDTRKKNIAPMSESILDLATDTKEEDRSSERTEVLYQVINQLEPLNRALILLFLDGKSYSEIAQIMGISESNVGTKLNRIKTKLKENKQLKTA